MGCMGCGGVMGVETSCAETGSVGLDKQWPLLSGPTSLLSIHGLGVLHGSRHGQGREREDKPRESFVRGAVVVRLLVVGQAVVRVFERGDGGNGSNVWGQQET